MHRFYIREQDIKEKTALIQGQDARHLTHVLRLSPGDHVELADGRGACWQARIIAMDSQGVTLDLISRTVLHGESPVSITVAQGMLKDKKMDMVIRHLTELGMTRWIPFFCPQVHSPARSGETDGPGGKMATDRPGGHETMQKKPTAAN